MFKNQGSTYSRGRLIHGYIRYVRPQKEFRTIDAEITKRLEKGVISTSHIEVGDYFSNIFTATKKDGTYRTILNLKFLNKECETHHFKMESLKQAIPMVKSNSYLASIDIKDAFYSVPIHESHKKYLKFMWVGVPYKFENIMVTLECLQELGFIILPSLC